MPIEIWSSDRDDAYCQAREWAKADDCDYAVSHWTTTLEGKPYEVFIAHATPLYHCAEAIVLDVVRPDGTVKPRPKAD